MYASIYCKGRLREPSNNFFLKFLGLDLIGTLGHCPNQGQGSANPKIYLIYPTIFALKLSINVVLRITLNAKKNIIFFSFGCPNIRVGGARRGINYDIQRNYLFC